MQGDASLSSRMGLSTKLGELVPHIFDFQARGKTKLSYTLNSLKAHITFELNEGDRAAGALGLKLWEGIWRFGISPEARLLKNLTCALLSNLGYKYSIGQNSGLSNVLKMCQECLG